MARPRFTGNGYTNPLNSLGFHAESRHRESPQHSKAFMSNETKIENSRPIRPLVLMANPAGTVAKKGILSRMKGWIGKKFAGRFGSRLGKKGAKDVIGEAGETTVTKKLKNKAAVESLEDTVKEGALSPVKKTFIRWGSFTVLGVAGIGAGYLLGQDVVDDLIGANCDEEVLAQGLTEGTPEYQEAVKGCQESAANKIAMIGMGAVAIVGLIGFAILKPKKKKDEE